LDAYKSIIFIKYRLLEEATAILNSLIALTAQSEMIDESGSIIYV
jgi:hypothetical protein